MVYSDFSIELVLKKMAEIFNKTSTPKKTAGVLLEALEIIRQLQKSAGQVSDDPLTLEELREMDGEPVYLPVGRCWVLVTFNGFASVFNWPDGSNW